MGFQTVGRIGHALAALGTLLVLTRSFPQAREVGIFASYLALYAWLDVLVDGGSNMALLRRASAAPDSLRPTLSRALVFRGCSAAAAIVIALLYSALDPDVGPRNLWGWLCALSLLCHLPAAYGVVFHLRLRFGFPSLARTLASMASFGVVALLAASGELRDPMLYVFVNLIFRAASNLAIAWGSLGLLREYPHGSAASPAAPRFVAESVQLGLGGAMREGYAQADMLLLRGLAGAEIAGLYAPARRTLSLALLLPNYLMTVATPPLAALAAAAAGEFQRNTLRLARGLFLFALPAALVSLPIAGPYLALFGARYADSAPALRILALAALAAYPGMVFLTALIARGGYRASLRIAALALAVNLIANAALISWWFAWGGAALALTGAALARVAAEAASLAASAGCWRARPDAAPDQAAHPSRTRPSPRGSSR